MNPPIPVPVVVFPKLCCGLPVVWVGPHSSVHECRNPKCSINSDGDILR